jgi:hypothetical protein
MKKMVSGAQKISAKREPYTIGQEFSRGEEGVGRSYRSTTENKFF